DDFVLPRDRGEYPVGSGKRVIYYSISLKEINGIEVDANEIERKYDITNYTDQFFVESGVNMDRDNILTEYKAYLKLGLMELRYYDDGTDRDFVDYDYEGNYCFFPNSLVEPHYEADYPEIFENVKFKIKDENGNYVLHSVYDYE